MAFVLWVKPNGIVSSAAGFFRAGETTETPIKGISIYYTLATMD